MASAQPSFQQPRYLAGIGISFAVHALLVALWQLARPSAPQDDAAAPRSQFLRLLPAPVASALPPAPAPARHRSGASAPAARQAPAPRALPAAPVPEAIALPADSGSAATPTLSGTDLLRDAKAAVGAVDRALRAENPERGIRAPFESRQTKLEKGIVRAGQLAPNKWYQAPKMEEIIDPGGYGRRRYRVVGAAGTYCITYESNHAPDGIDSMREGIKPKLTNCEETEEPAKAQKWNR